MKKLKPLKSKSPVRMVQIDENTWIETRAGLPDEIVRQNYIRKRIESLERLTGQPVQKVA